ncbi:MAG: hypothetical protein J6N76_07245 [Lachnospiraceae bacterium]|nr:hypothetical protein [Lachnospiraceae bacterium]
MAKTDKKQRTERGSSTGGISLANSIKTKLIVVMALLVAVPLLVSLIFSTVNTIEAGVENANTLNRAQASIIEESIVGILDQNVQALQTLAASPATIAYLQGNGDGELEGDVFRQLQLMDES